MIIDFYSKCRIFGNPIAFPFAGGWGEQPCRIVDLIESLLVIEKVIDSGNNKR